MTAILALVAEDCAVMASDTEATSSDNTRFDTDKIWPAGALLAAFCGPASTRVRVQHAVEQTVEKKWKGATDISRNEARDVLVKVLSPLYREIYDTFVESAPGQSAKSIAGGDLLIIGKDSEGYWILEINEHAQATPYSHFRAIGSGGDAAHISAALLRHYLPAAASVDRLRLVGYRIIKTCIESLGGELGVGGDVRLWSRVPGSLCAQSDEQDLVAIAEGLAQWQTLEREALEFAGTTIRSEQMPIPEALDEAA